MELLKFFKSEYPLHKRIIGVIQTFWNDGIGRTLLKINFKYKFTSYVKMQQFIKFLKIVSHPLDYIGRRSLAKKVLAHSPYARVVPSETASVFLDIQSIPGAPAVIHACQQFIQSNSDMLEECAKKDTFAYLLLANPSSEYGITLSNQDIYDLEKIPGLTDLALSDMLLETTASYLGEAPILAGVTLYTSFPNKTTEGSQLYHIDKGDLRQMKFLFAITDVTDEHGPFTFVPANQADRVKDKLGESFYARIQDQQVYDVVGKEAAVRFKGPAGSTLIIDTGRCLHYGSRHNTKMRGLLEIQYMSRFNIVEPSFYFSRVNLGPLPQVLTLLQKMALAMVKRV